MRYKLVCFDLDGTLVRNTSSSWQMFHDAFGVDKEVRKQAYDDFFAGKITYEQWAHHDIELWKALGKTREDFMKAMKNAQIAKMQGADEVLKALKEKGVRLAIISGSIDIVIEFIFPNYKELFSDIYVSKLFFDEQQSIKKILPTEYDMQGKAVALKEIAKAEGLDLSECVFVGDHLNDRDAAREAGFAIAFDAKDEQLREICDVCVEKDLREILPFIVQSQTI